MEYGDSEHAAGVLIGEIEERYSSGDFPMYELLDAPTPCTLGNSMWEDGTTVLLGLAYGDPLARPVGPLVHVITARTTHAPGASRLLTEECQERGLAPPHVFEEKEMLASVDGELIMARRTDTAQAWAAQLDLSDATVTTVAIGWDTTRLELASLGDITPYLEGWREKLPPDLS